MRALIALCTLGFYKKKIINMYRSHFRLHPKPELIAHRLSCIDRTIPIDQLLLVAGLQDPSVTSTLIQQNREGLDSGEQNIDPQLQPGALLSRWVGEIHPPTPALVTSPPSPPSFTLLAQPCISIVSFWPCAALSQWMSLDWWEAPPKTAAAGSLLLLTAAYAVKLLYSQHTGASHQPPPLAYLFTNQRPALVLNYYSVLLSSPLQRACIYPAWATCSSSAHTISSIALMSNCDKWV